MSVLRFFLLKRYGEATISRDRLFLTDDDVAEHGLLDSCIKIMQCYAISNHMLCVFHAVVMSYHEKVYPKLPHKRGSKKKLLTDAGKRYCEILF